MVPVIDKEYCMSSFLALRYVHDEDKIWKEGVVPKRIKAVREDELIGCKTATDIDNSIRNIIAKTDLSKAALLLSGGIDSGILASYMPRGTKAYTCHSSCTDTDLEVNRAKKICEINGLEHHIVEITWDTYDENMNSMMIKDGCPVSANEPQVFALVKKAVSDGVGLIIIGDNADMAFGGMDRLLSKDWSFDEWIERYTFVRPDLVLKNPRNMNYLFEKYRIGQSIDYLRFLKDVFLNSSGIAYYNAFNYWNVDYLDPFAYLKMTDPLDLRRVRNGESKYLLRELYHNKYPDLPVPEKLPMPRPMDIWMKDWEGPKRPEFIPGCTENLTYEQKFLVYSLERFLNLIETM